MIYYTSRKRSHETEKQVFLTLYLFIYRKVNPRSWVRTNFFDCPERSKSFKQYYVTELLNEGIITFVSEKKKDLDKTIVVIRLFNRFFL